MVKIEIEVKDGEGDTCIVTVRKPKKLKSATVTEVKTANAVKLRIDDTIQTLSNKERN